MLRRSILAAAVVTLMATPALAHHCPADSKAIDAALAVSTLSDAVKAENTALKDQGLALHNAGDHRSRVMRQHTHSTGSMARSATRSPGTLASSVCYDWRTSPMVS